MARVPLTGGAYQARSLIAAAQKCVNLFPENNPEPASQAPVVTTHYLTPGLRFLGRPSDQPGTPDPIPVPPVAPYTTGAVHFDGATYLTRADLSGAADSPLLTLSVWLNFTLPFSSYDFVYWSESFPSSAAFVQIDFTTISGSDVGVFFSLNGASAELFSGRGTAIAPGGWVNVKMAFDTGHAAGLKTAQIYFGDMPLVITIENDTDPSFNMGFAALVQTDAFGNSVFFIGDGADFWAGTGQLIDLSVEANRRKFISATGKPVDLGTDGSTPTGTAPSFFLRRAPSGAASTFAADLSGHANDFTITGGVLTDASTSPSD